MSGGYFVETGIAQEYFGFVGKFTIHHGNWDEDPPLPGSSLPRLSYLKALMPPSSIFNLQTQESSESETDDRNMDPESNVEAGQEHLFPCPSLRTLEALFRSDHLPVGLDEAYLRAFVRCSRIRGQAGHPFKYIANCCGSLSFAENIAAWLQVHDGFPAEVIRSVG